MIRDIEGIFSAHRQRYASSEVTSLIELLLKLMAENPPDLQVREMHGSIGRPDLMDQVYGRIALRSFTWEQEPFIPFVITEIAAGRPVGLWLSNKLTLSGRKGERGWIVVRINTVGNYVFADLYSKRPEQGDGDGHFTEKRVLRLDGLSQEHVSMSIYCEELFPRPPQRSRKPSDRRGG